MTSTAHRFCRRQQRRCASKPPADPDAHPNCRRSSPWVANACRHCIREECPHRSRPRGGYCSSTHHTAGDMPHEFSTRPELRRLRSRQSRIQSSVPYASTSFLPETQHLIPSVERDLRITDTKAESERLTLSSVSKPITDRSFADSSLRATRMDLQSLSKILSETLSWHTGRTPPGSCWPPWKLTIRRHGSGPPQLSRL